MFQFVTRSLARMRRNTVAAPPQPQPIEHRHVHLHNPTGKRRNHGRSRRHGATMTRAYKVRTHSRRAAEVLALRSTPLH